MDSAAFQRMPLSRSVLKSRKLVKLSRGIHEMFSKSAWFSSLYDSIKVSLCLLVKESARTSAPRSTTREEKSLSGAPSLGHDTSRLFLWVADLGESKVLRCSKMFFCLRTWDSYSFEKKSHHEIRISSINVAGKSGWGTFHKVWYQVSLTNLNLKLGKYNWCKCDRSD